tara:strand:- start:3162 stop:3572 length:411 start_codon:yes stop_codon:yes gene_type:complete
MAKLGRYSSDRKKITALTASTSASVAKCGTVFTAVGDAAVVLTLPTIADAGKGWWCKLVKSGAASGGATITLAAHADDGSTPMKGIEASNTCTALSGDDLVIADAAAPGCQAEAVCDGDRWIILAHGVAAGDITIG